MHITCVPLEERLAKGLITRVDLRIRSLNGGGIQQDNSPIYVDGRWGCPVCLSEMPQGCSLVTLPSRAKACDYCVTYIEDEDN